ncbi:unnamed protein product [Prorocentrum cordatum]|uniref:C3H1-type domain-containing protein n=1 Tax=Prorocentrum cordatum TaxID=2364126 RepID=A0ABN9W838_9DINO|nr:unnamed protein product [Polarella glacialis]
MNAVYTDMHFRRSAWIFLRSALEPPGGASGAALSACHAPGRGVQRWSKKSARASESLRSVSLSVPRASGSHCSLSDLSDSRWGVSDWSEHESSGISASGSCHSENHSPRRAEESEAVEQQDAEWRRDNEAQHAAGTCKPCLYHRTEAGCALGRACRFYHLPHAARRRARPSTAGRAPCGQPAARPDGKREGGAEAVRDSADGCPLAQRHVPSALREGGQQQGPLGAEPGGAAQAAAGEEPKRLPSCG